MRPKAKLEIARTQRILHSSKIHKEEFGQYITPYTIAEFMSKMFPLNADKFYKILDPGAGLGTLSAALITRILSEQPDAKIHLDCYEIDKSILPLLHNTYSDYENNENIKINIIERDYIQESAFTIGFNYNCDYTYIIMNPPYKKLNSRSAARLHLRDVGIETVNYYTAFLSLSILQLKKDGYISAIIPRSFCNGLYYLPFRRLLLGETKIRRIHLFNSRKDSFKEESVLQENVIMLLHKSKEESDVIIGSSDNALFANYNEYKYSGKIVKPEDEQLFITIPKNNECTGDLFFTKASDLEISISTGPVVDFRSKEYLRNEYTDKAVPLLYSAHLKNMRLNWPVAGKKPNAIIPEREDIKKSLFPKGNYVLIRRFSSKEEKRRVVASIILENDLIDNYFAIENHLNVVHTSKNGLPVDLAYGLLAFYNSKYFDEKFREFSGHTQVNSTDLRNVMYPTAEQLINIGKKFKKTSLSFDMADEMINSEINNGQ